MSARDAAARRRRNVETARFCQDQAAGLPVLARPEWQELEWSDDAVRHQVDTGRWSRPTRGFVVLQPGEQQFLTRVRIAWLAAGRDAVVSGTAAAHLLGLTVDAPPTIEVQVPHGRRPTQRPGMVLRHVRRQRDYRVVAGVHVTSVEDTVLDLVSSAARFPEAIPWIERACGRRLTTPALIVDALARRSRLRHRRDVLALCSRLAAGEMSWLERWCSDRVLRRHGLPPGRRQVRRTMEGRTTYSDVELDPYPVVLELDGRLGHDNAAFRDMSRDNAHAEDGRVVLRYGHADSRRSPCAVALQIATVLTHHGWSGRLRRCGPTCTIPQM